MSGSVTRQMFRTRAQQILQQVTWEETVTFVLPRKQPARRMDYQAINQAAYRALGVGNYKMGTKNDYVWVRKTRTS